MENQQLNAFKQQIQSDIYNNAFISVERWTSHLIYMIYNQDEYWLNILSIFNFRTAPVRVLRHSIWKEKIEPANPIIKKGLTGIPILVKESKMNMIGVKTNQEKIVHDAWDINDFIDGEKMKIASPFFNEIKHAQKYNLKFDFNRWNEFIESLLESDFSSLSEELKTFFKESFLYLIFGNEDIGMEYITIYKENTNVLCRIYKNMVSLLNSAYIAFKSYVALEIAKQEGEQEKEALKQRIRRKLPQRLEDAEKQLMKKGE